MGRLIALPNSTKRALKSNQYARRGTVERQGDMRSKGLSTRSSNVETGLDLKCNIDGDFIDRTCDVSSRLRRREQCSAILSLEDDEAFRKKSKRISVSNSSSACGPLSSSS